MWSPPCARPLTAGGLRAVRLLFLRAVRPRFRRAVRLRSLRNLKSCGTPFPVPRALSGFRSVLAKVRSGGLSVAEIPKKIRNVRAISIDGAFSIGGAISINSAFSIGGAFSINSAFSIGGAISGVRQTANRGNLRLHAAGTAGGAFRSRAPAERLNFFVCERLSWICVGHDVLSRAFRRDSADSTKKHPRTSRMSKCRAILAGPRLPVRPFPPSWLPCAPCAFRRCCLCNA